MSYEAHALPTFQLKFNQEFAAKAHGQASHALRGKSAESVSFLPTGMNEKPSLVEGFF
jgi:hypothetical protein